MSTKRIGALLIVLAIALSAALATNQPTHLTTPTKKNGQLWGVASADATYYYLSANVTNLIEGVDYSCEEDENSTCLIEADPADIEEYAPGQFRVRKLVIIIITPWGRLVIII
jgi:hypothetical protein